MDKELRSWLSALGKFGFVVRRYGRDRERPFLVSAAYKHSSCVDVILMGYRDDDAAVAYRTPCCDDPFAPEFVTYIESTTTQATIMTAFGWPDPTTDTDTPALMTPPPGFGVSENLRNGTVFVYWPSGGVRQKTPLRDPCPQP